MKKAKTAIRVAPKAPIQRTTEGLRGALIDEIDGLRAGKSDVAKANATAKLVGAVVNTVRLELSVAKFLNRTGKSPKFETLMLGR